MRIVMMGPFGLEPRMTMRARAFQLARHLVMAGHQVSILMPPVHIPEKAGRRWTEDGVELSYVSLSPLRMPLSAPLITWRLLRHAYAWHPDVIHVFKPIGHAGAAAWLHQLTHRFSRPVPLVIDEDDWEGTGGWNETMPRSPVTRWLVGRQEGWALGNATAVTVASQALQSMAWSMRHDPANVHYLPNGPREWPAGDRETMRVHLGIGAAPVVLLYTRFFEYDVERVAETFRLIRVRQPDARLLVVGQGLEPTAEARFYDSIEQKGLTPFVTRSGWIAEDELPGYFAAADVALYPFDDTLINRTKCPVKLTDLLYAGVPVVADAVGEIVAYIRHRETGLLVPARTPQAMADAALEVLQDGAMADRLSRQAVQAMRTRYAWSARADQLQKIYEHLLAEASETQGRQA